MQLLEIGKCRDRFICCKVLAIRMSVLGLCNDNRQMHITARRGVSREAVRSLAPTRKFMVTQSNPTTHSIFQESLLVVDEAGPCHRSVIPKIIGKGC